MTNKSTWKDYILKPIHKYIQTLQKSILGAQLKLYHSTTSINLNPKTNSTSTTNQTINFKQLLKTHCHHLFGDQAYYTPPLGMLSGHVQTLCCAATNSSVTDKVHYERKIIRVPDGGQIEIDFSPPGAFDNPKDPTPVLVLLHGLTGGSHESYVRAMVSPIIQDLGWRVMVTNFRGCAGSKVTSPKLYHAGATDDLRSSLFFLSHLIPAETHLHGIGFSLGANILAKYLGEEKEASVLRTGVVLANPWDLYNGNLYLESSFIQRIYSRVLAFSLRSMFKRHKEFFLTANQTQSNDSSMKVDIDLLFSDPYQTLYEFDTIVTRVLCGFPSTEHYYKTQSSANVVSHVRVPLLGLNALDDVIASSKGVPIHATVDNPYLVLGLTKNGGHLGWFEGILFGSKRFITRPVLEWFKTLNDHTDCSAPKDSLPQELSKVSIGGPMIKSITRPNEIGFQLIDIKSANEMECLGERVARETLKDAQSWEYLKLVLWDGGRSWRERKVKKD
ncbi:alpha/beta hydrolase [Melampsora larici-populina 98AG31]|uniref:Alpha/beta hydrolase n=1 Tax=Melampsora larici-populina (strain 98AG31 / pathotype 3-4-7) TaxID=747676 RepID=F4S424_MELLP|nr:alpha/beta hydrolase [Melampsora larici-populina 98AG31]EGG00639.1 alpha/beta hydrolase [Melampsora larici-populina 98AG31]